MVSHVIFEMVFVFSDEWALSTRKHFFGLDVLFAVLPKTQFCNSNKFALFAFECFDFSVRVDRRHA